MKVLFLDIDGVLCTHQEYARSEYDPEYETHIYPFKKECVDNLNKILEQTDAKVVVSSTWRRLFSKENLQKIFKQNGLNADIFDVTPGTISGTRSREINLWLEDHDKCKFVVLDDLDLSASFDMFVHTDERFGLTEGQTEEAISILND